MNGYPTGKHEKDDQKNTMETQPFNHLAYLNMTVGVLHYRAPLLSTPIPSDNSCLVRVIGFRVPESTQQTPAFPDMPDIQTARRCHSRARGGPA